MRTVGEVCIGDVGIVKGKGGLEMVQDFKMRKYAWTDRQRWGIG